MNTDDLSTASIGIPSEFENEELTILFKTDLGVVSRTTRPLFNLGIVSMASGTRSGAWYSPDRPR